MAATSESSTWNLVNKHFNAGQVVAAYRDAKDHYEEEKKKEGEFCPIHDMNVY